MTLIPELYNSIRALISNLSENGMKYVEALGLFLSNIEKAFRIDLGTIDDDLIQGSKMALADLTTILRNVFETKNGLIDKCFSPLGFEVSSINDISPHYILIGILVLCIYFVLLHIKLSLPHCTFQIQLFFHLKVFHFQLISLHHQF